MLTRRQAGAVDVGLLGPPRIADAVAFAPRRSATDVFINIPFDPHHEYLYLSLITGLVASGLNPRCVVEIPSGDDRLARIFKLISACPYSVHDLSAVGLSGKPFRVPRFNMPFELGLAVALNLTSHGRHRFRILEAVKHRAEQSLSDLTRMLASAVGFSASGELLVGAAARNQQALAKLWRRQRRRPTQRDRVRFAS